MGDQHFGPIIIAIRGSLVKRIRQRVDLGILGIFEHAADHRLHI